MYNKAKNIFIAMTSILGVATNVAKINAITAAGSIAATDIAVAIVAEECSPPMVWIPGKCEWLMYVGGTVTCNPIWFGAETTVLTSIL